MKVLTNYSQNIPVSFKGHEAKRLDRILVHNNDKFGSDALFKELDSIASRYRVDVQKVKYLTDVWIQDELYFTPNKKVLSSNYNYGFAYSQLYDLEADSLTSRKNPLCYFHIDGGNVFFVTDKDGKQVILSAKDYDGKCQMQGHAEFFDADRVIELPRADYHADLFVTPIGDNKILVASDKLMLDSLNKIIEACVSFVSNNPDDKSVEDILQLLKNISILRDDFSKNIDEYKFKGCDDETADILAQNGFEVIRVPSRIYNFEKLHNPETRDFITNILNFSNAITFKDRRNNTVLVAAKSSVEKKLGFTEELAKKIGVNFERLFIESVQPHIKPENIHFILGDRKRPISEILEENKGGLHCMCVEVPEYDDFQWLNI